MYTDGIYPPVHAALWEIQYNEKIINAIFIIAALATIASFCIQCPASGTMSVFSVAKDFIDKHGMLFFGLCVLLITIVVILIMRLYSAAGKNKTNDKHNENVSLNVENVYVHHQTLKLLFNKKNSTCT